jgi:membrane fusion protein (multidrug efflux system)
MNRLENTLSANNESKSSTQLPGRKKLHRAIAYLIVLVAIAAGITYYLRSRSFESTDNAFIEGSIVQISPRVPGQIVRVYVTDNQRVQKGDLLIEIDARDYELKVAETKARLIDAQARLSSAQSGVSLTTDITGAMLVQATAALDAARNQIDILSARVQQEDADVQAAEAALHQAEASRTASEAGARRAQSDATRYRALFKKDEVSRQTLDRTEADEKASAATLEAAGYAVTGARARLDQVKAARTATASSLQQAKNLAQQAAGRLQEARAGSTQVRIRESEVKSVNAQLDQLDSMSRSAELNLSYTRIYAPEDGTVTRKSVEPGNFVQVGQAMMALVTDRLWVVANYKETQLTHMKPGQPVDIKIDAYPQHKLKGKVDSIQTGTGARFSLLPAENATGNYVKVIQRMPVKITFLEPPPSDIRLGPGMSVVPRVRVR